MKYAIDTDEDQRFFKNAKSAMDEIAPNAEKFIVNRRPAYEEDVIFTSIEDAEKEAVKQLKERKINCSEIMAVTDDVPEEYLPMAGVIFSGPYEIASITVFPS